MTSIVQLKAECDQHFMDIRGDLIRLGQMTEANKTDILNVQSELGNMRGDMATSVTKINADFKELSDVLQIKQHTALEGMNEVVNQAGITFAEQQSKLDVHHRTFVEEHEKFERMQKDVGELHRRTEVSIIDLQTWVRRVEAKVDQGGGGPGGAVETGRMDKMQHDLQNLYQMSERSIIDLQKRCQELEARAHQAGCGHDGGKGGKGHSRGYLPQKHLIPESFDNKMDDWRQWLDDLLGYLENCNPGMKAFLKNLAGRDDPPDEFFYQQQSTQFPEAVTKDGAEIFRTLKALTAGEARKIVTSVDSDNGFLAFWKLVRHNNPHLAELQGTALARLTQMGLTRASTPTETKHKVTEMEVNIKYAEAVIGEGLNDLHLKSIILGFIDPLTRAHTVAHQAADVLFETFKRHVLAFCNGNIGHGGGAVPMAIGAVAVTEPEAKPEASLTGDWGPGEWEEYLTTMGKGGARLCYQCGKPGHIARECLQKGKGGGKGKGKFGGDKGFDKGKGKFGGGNFDKGKGKGKGPKGGCFTCGGDHYAWECPRQGNKGGFGTKGWKGGQMRMLDGPYEEYSWREYEPLCMLRTCMCEKKDAEDVEDLYDEMQLLDKSIEDLCNDMHNMAKSAKDLNCKWHYKNADTLTVANKFEALSEEEVLVPVVSEIWEIIDAKNEEDGTEKAADEPNGAVTFLQPRSEKGDRNHGSQSEDGTEAATQNEVNEKEELAKEERRRRNEVKWGCKFRDHGHKDFRSANFDTFTDPEAEDVDVSSTSTAGGSSPDIKAADAKKFPDVRGAMVVPSDEVPTETPTKEDDVDDDGPETWQIKVKGRRRRKKQRDGVEETERPKMKLPVSVEKKLDEVIKKVEAKMEENKNAMEDMKEIWEVIEEEKNSKGEEIFSGTPKAARGFLTAAKGFFGPLIRVEPGGINAVRHKDGWEEVKLYVDSGATETVVGEGMLTSVDIVEGAASRIGVTYEVANGLRIPNLGEKKFCGISAEGCRRGLTAQVCDVNKALLSVSRLVKQGHRVVFDDDNSFVEDKITGERMWLTEENGMYALTLWVKASF